MIRLFYFTFLFFLFACSNEKKASPTVLIETSLGDIEVELYNEQAPKSVAAFLLFVDSAVYKNSSFYRVILEESGIASNNSGLIQGGTWPSKNDSISFVKNIEHEPTSITKLSHTTGTVSLARTGAGTASTEFFICIGDQTHFDQGGNTPSDGLGMAAFGRVIKGMPVVRKIQQQPFTGDMFDRKIEIKNVRRM